MVIEKGYLRISEIPFSSEHTRMTTNHKMDNENIVTYIKDAPETILNRCRYLFVSGQVKKISSGNVKRF